MGNVLDQVKAFTVKWGPNRRAAGLELGLELMKEFTSDLFELLQMVNAPGGEAVFKPAVDHQAGSPDFEPEVVKLRDRLLEVVKLHEGAQGPPCWKERVNVVAYLAHALRLGPPLMIAVLKRMVGLEGEHKKRHGEEEHGRSHP